MKLSVAVMAHPQRAEFIPELLESLGQGTVVWDEINDRWDTGRRAMLAYDPFATHHVVVQDDAIVCRDFVAGVEEALEHVPPFHPVGLYLGRVRPYGALVSRLVAQAGDASWITMPAINWGVAIVVPVVTLEEMIEYCDLWDRDKNYDRRLSRWFEKGKLRCWYTWPSLVEHRDSPSLVANRGGGRHAHRFLGADVSALGLDWTKGAIDMQETQTELRNARLDKRRALLKARAAERAARLEAGEHI